jgi:predicted nuclease of predicted toxin-antitoxin system
MKVRFQADADLKHAILSATLRREPTIDFRGATSADLPGRDDMEVLAIAAQEGRVLVSHDNRTMPSHFAEFIARNTSPGVVIASQRLGIAIVCRRTALDLFSIRRG